jgi:hypothetical protein
MLGQRVGDPGAVVRVTGVGAPGGPVAPPAPAPVATPAPYDFRTITVSATGSGACPPQMGPTPQGKAMAQRAAKLDALRNLGENVKGVRVDSATYVRDFVTVSDEINSRFEGFLRGAVVVDTREVEPCLFEVTVEITLTELGDIVLAGRRPNGQGGYAQPAPSGYGQPAPGYGGGYGQPSPPPPPPSGPGGGWRQ